MVAVGEVDWGSAWFFTYISLTSAINDDDKKKKEKDAEEINSW